MKEKLTNENVRKRFEEYNRNEPVNLSKLSLIIGLDNKQKRYLLSRFMQGKDLNDSTLETLSEYLTKRGY